MVISESDGFEVFICEDYQDAMKVEATFRRPNGVCPTTTLVWQHESVEEIVKVEECGDDGCEAVCEVCGDELPEGHPVVYTDADEDAPGSGVCASHLIEVGDEL